MEKYNILYTTDTNYFVHMLTSIYSLLENNKECPITLHVIENNFTQVERNTLELFVADYKDVELKIYEWNPSLESYVMPKWRGTDIANARLFSREILQDVRKVLYLDSDTVIDNPLNDLFNKDSSNPVGAVLDFNIPYHLKGLVNSYFNSGVLLFDYNLWDKEDCTKIIYDTFQKNKVPLVFPDQDLLNLALEDKISMLDMSYNVTPLIYDMVKHPYLTEKCSSKKNYYNYDEVVETVKNPHIYHMIAYFNDRPWYPNNHHPFNRIYEYYRMGWDTEFNSIKGDDNLKINMMAFTNMMINSFLPDTINYKLKQKVRKLYKK